MKISSKKRVAFAVVTTAALALGTMTGANALNGKPNSGTPGAGYEAQSAQHETKRAEHKTLISSIIGLDAATIEKRVKAGETLGAIAGAKKPELIAALVTEATKNIDAAVTSGKITAAQAATIKSGLVEKVTVGVDSARGAMGPGNGGQMARGAMGPGNGGQMDHKNFGKHVKRFNF